MVANPDAASPKLQAAIALHRFGFGPRPGGIDAIFSDPRGALISELRPGAGRIRNPALLSSGQAVRAVRKFRMQSRAARLAQPSQSALSPVSSSGAHTNDQEQQGRMAGVQDPASDGVTAPKMPGGQPGAPNPRQIFLGEVQARYEAALRADIGLAERLVWFWSNHFCVSANKGPVWPICGAYEREAIRPHVLGKFSNMLLAVCAHPAMLLYLDNTQSVGPHSPFGLRSGRGLNENLAREIMELHTLGVRTVYDQTDVTTFAKVLTGWTVMPAQRDPARAGEFLFNPSMHEPGAQTVIGKSFPEAGFEQGRAVLKTLAHHPATAKHIGGKLAQYFVADEPPASLVEKLTKRFLDTEGDLMEVTKALITAPESWDAPRTKLKKPAEWIVAAMRTSGPVVNEVQHIIQMQNVLGEPLWRPPAPKGFSSDSAAWLDGVAERLDIANQIARLAGDKEQEPDAMVDAALGPLASAETRQAVRRAQSRAQALALLLLAPEFQRG